MFNIKNNSDVNKLTIIIPSGTTDTQINKINEMIDAYKEQYLKRFNIDVELILKEPIIEMTPDAGTIIALGKTAHSG